MPAQAGISASPPSKGGMSARADMTDKIKKNRVIPNEVRNLKSKT